ncbi:MAG: MMPL family transporter, partial [Bacteroidales bacterium]|nr:MMPL family transporter [Bacteroidales bacterium]
VLAFHVNINTDMTKYLPDDSNMRAGLEIMSDEFGDLAEMGGSDIRVMCQNLTDEEKVDMMVDLRKIKQVNSVREQENGIRTLYELGVSKSVDQVTLGKEIANQYPKVKVVETGQDGATAEAPMLMGAVALLLIILFAMCQSWLEPVLFLASTGIAVLINVGTNAFLPSVSVTTNSIVAILQLVLSMDYSIILINRFRQERLTTDNSVTAMQRAIKLAASSILSSALTTIVGLIMLVFMKLKIGADLGVVLSKGVLCSLICNFTVLPALILLFEKGIDKSTKKVLSLQTDKLAHFSMRFRIPLLLLFITIFVGSYILRTQTNIIFLNAKESKIEKYFPKKNPVVLIYDNADEGKVARLMDSVMATPGVDMVLSYPSLLLREYTAPQMVEAINDMRGIMAGMDSGDMPDVNMDMLSDDVLKLVYYVAHNNGKELTMGFNEMADFILAQAKAPNSLIAKQMDDEFKSKINMLDELRHPKKIAEASPIKKSEEPAAKITSPAEQVLDVEFAPSASEVPAILETMTDNHTAQSTSPFADTAMLNKRMTASEMASFLGMDDGQAKSVYKLAKHADGTMTPIQFVHFVTEDILQRKLLAVMIKDSQRKQLIAVQNTMDSALIAASMRPAASEASSHASSAVTANRAATPKVDLQTVQNTDSAISVIPKLTYKKPKLDRNDPLVLLEELLYGNKQYTIPEMTHNLSVLGEDIPEGLVSLLYLYHGGNVEYDDNWTMSLEHMVNFLADTVLNDKRFESFVDDSLRDSFGQMQQALIDGVGKLRSDNHSIAMIITDFATESSDTYNFIDHFNTLCKKAFGKPYYAIGESVMLSEMKAGFNKEMLLVTLLTIAAIFFIVSLTFRSVILSAILVMTVMSGVFVNVVVSGLGGGSLLYLAYLIVQSILMGAAIDYGILFANYYREKRATLPIGDALKESYKCSIHTILTSGMILILVPAIMTILVSDPTISDIVKSISIGALATVTLILFVLPGVLACTDKIIVRKNKCEVEKSRIDN